MTSGAPTLFATASTVRAIAEARAAAILVGSYDGSGNYGDIAQLDAALGLVARLGPGLLVLPVLEREYLAGHQALAEHSGQQPSHALFFDPGGDIEDDLLPVAAPVELIFGACYLYGGGYLNHLWGNRKLAMLRSAEALLGAGGAELVSRLSSGLQVDAEWVARLDPADAAALRSFDLLGVRDAGSSQALAALDSTAPVIETADDAVGVLRLLPGPEAPRVFDGDLHINLHFAEHDWVSEHPDAVLDFYTCFLAELGRLAGLPVVAHPLIAYLDGRVDERRSVGRLRDTCAERGIKVAESLVLRPTGLAAAAPGLRQASLTLSCSYHVALTSLMLEVPAVLIGDNTYYEQKAAGLSEAFGLPPELTPSTADPFASAREVAATVLDEKRGTALRRQLAAKGDRMRCRRGAIEAELLARLGGTAVTSLTARVEELSERLCQRSAEPAELLAQLAALRSDYEELQRRAGESSSPLDAELRAREAEARSAEAQEASLDAELRAREAEARSAEAQQTLSAVLTSRSWRMTAALRRVAAPLRRVWRRP